MSVPNEKFRDGDWTVFSSFHEYSERLRVKPENITTNVIRI